MGALSFLNPAYLGALALGAIPILIHLIRQRRIRVIEWAAWEFLLQSQRRNRRRLRLEQLFLLLLRITIVCLVVLALSRPVLSTIGLPLLASQPRIHVLIALDNSLSMGYRMGGVSDFDRAKRVAETLLARAVKQGDSVSLVLISGRSESVFKEPTFDLAKVRQRIRSARLNDFETDYGKAAAFCARILNGVRSPNREIYWITDSQRTGLPETGAVAARAFWKELTTAGRLTWIDVSSTSRDNLSVDAPIVSRELVTPRSPVRIEAQVHNYGAAAKNNLLVNLTVDGKPAGAARVNLPPHGHAIAQFGYLFEKPGVHTGTVQLGQPDQLEGDNSSSFALKVRDKLSLLLVNPTPSVDPAKDEAFYLATALAPGGSSGSSTSTIQPLVHSGMHLSSVDLRAFDGVVITGLASIEPPDRRALEEYVRNGGGLLIFPSPGADPVRINAALGGSESLLPVMLGPRHIMSEENAAALNPASISNPALASLRDTSELDLGSARFMVTFDVNPPPNDDSIIIICRFTGGQPALIERRFGQGRVILAATTAGATGTDLPYKPVYVPLVHQLAAYLAAGPASLRNLDVGQPIVARFDVRAAGKPVTISTPSGAAVSGNSVLGAQGLVVTLTSTPDSGIYRAHIPGEPDQAFAVNSIPPESDLSTALETQVREYTGPVKFQYAHGSEDVETIVRRSRHGTEIWKSLIVAVLPLLFLEAFLAQRFGRRG